VRLFSSPSDRASADSIALRYASSARPAGPRFRSRRCPPTTDVARCSTTFSARNSRSSATPANPRVALDAKTLAALQVLGARFVALYPFGGLPQGDGVPRDGSVSALAEVEDLTGEGVAWFRSVGAKKGSVAIIRPDKFVYALTPAAGAAAAVAQVLAALQERRGDALPEKQSVAAAFA